ncbi:hypothetical protein TsFJ059_007491 [Trichoderma semiorbis]|uniref:Uncharacterized protein n=1 Tax=Trichoderma semiorbis TaxID=1491008 RepID=A0A9P8HP54_9HYPO|nr:hypothetical protein TsFJ059_007491 [Trichoderma semiorbis]
MTPSNARATRPPVVKLDCLRILTPPFQSQPWWPTPPVLKQPVSSLDATLQAPESCPEHQMHKQDSAHAWAHGYGTSNVRTYEAPSLPLRSSQAGTVQRLYVQRPCSASRAKRRSSLAVLSFAAAVLRLRLRQAQGVCAHHAIPAPTSTSPPSQGTLVPPSCQLLLQTHQYLVACTRPPHFPPLHHTTPCPHHSHFQSHSSIPEEYICIPLPSFHLSTASRQPHQLSPSTTLLSFQGIAKTLVNSFYNTLTLRPLSASEPLRLILLALAYSGLFPRLLFYTQPTTNAMALDMWTHEFCLTCDRQVQVDGDAYCSEACRMSDFEKTPSTPSSQASSPGFSPVSYARSGSLSSRPAPTKFVLSPAYDFNQAQPYGSTPRSSSSFGSYMSDMSPLSSNRGLTPSSSHSSLCSMQSVSSTAEASQLSDKARMELRAYAVSFEQVRLQRRRSY